MESAGLSGQAAIVGFLYVSQFMCNIFKSSTLGATCGRYNEKLVCAVYKRSRRNQLPIVAIYTGELNSILLVTNVLCVRGTSLRK